MQTIYFVLTAVALYFASDWLLQHAEMRAGRRFASRSLIFFGIFLVLLFTSFAILRSIAAP